jgi:hypothetical protein
MMQFLNNYLNILKEAYEDLTKSMESETSRGFVMMVMILTPIFGTLFFFAVLVNASEYIAPEPTVRIEAVQIDKNKVVVNLSKNTTLLNAVEVEMFFDPKAIAVTDVIIHPEICEERFVLTKVIDNTAGTIFYQCGTISPFSGTSTTLATIMIAPITSGATPLTFGSSTNALASDGYGSNVTKERIDSVMTVAL